MHVHKFIFPLILIALTAMLSGCAGVAVEGAQAAKSEVVIRKNLDEAKAGNAEAQYKVGSAYCCSLHEGSGLYNTPKSVDWLCKSARQGYTPAMHMLGKIYSGDTVDGIRLMRRAAGLFASNSTDLPTAMTWFQLAKDNGEEVPADRIDDVWADMSESEKAEMQALYAKGLNAKCSWEEVIGS